MYITKVMETETGHRLVNYDGKCSHLHGHSYRWEVTVWAPDLDARGMVMDFSELKEAMTQRVAHLDHAMVLCDRDPAYRVLKDMPATNGTTQRVIGVPFNPTAENLAALIAGQLQAELSDGVYVVRVRVWETSSSNATWEDEDHVR